MGIKDKFQIRAGHGPGLTWALSPLLFDTAEAAKAAAETWGGTHPFDGEIAIWIKRVPNLTTHALRRTVSDASVSTPILRKTRPQLPP